MKKKKISSKKKKIELKKKQLNQKKLFSQLNFKNFITGKSNQEAKAIAFQITRNIKRIYNPIILYGKSGLGKTHLLHAIKNEIITKKKSYKTKYIHSVNFVQKMVKALKTKKVDKFKKLYKSIKILLIDDIQFLENKKKTQEEILHIFNCLLEKKRQIVLTTNKLPNNIFGITKALKAKLEKGLIITINSPEFTTRISILMHLANKKKIILPYKIAFFIAQKIFKNIPSLEGALNQIKFYSHFSKKKITINFVKKILVNILPKKNKPISIDQIQKTVAFFYKIKKSEIIKKKRTKSLVFPRQIAIAICKKLTNFSLSEIGYAFGKRTHTTILYACKKIKKLKTKKTNIKKEFSYLTKILLKKNELDYKK